MPQIINTNIYSINAQNSLNRTQGDLQTALQRLSSGLRINSAKDDAAGLAISERFTAQIRGYHQATRNANDGVSLAQTAESAMQEITNNLQRIRELSIQAVNASNSSIDRKSIGEEVSQLIREINRVKDTQFNGVEVLDVSQTLTFQIGPNQGDTITISLGRLISRTGFPSVLAQSAIGNSTTNATVSAFNSLIGTVDLALDSVNSQRSLFGALQNRFETIIRNNENVAENLSASRSRIRDADFAAETAALTRAQILQQAGTTVLSQANQVPQSVLQLLG